LQPYGAFSKSRNSDPSGWNYRCDRKRHHDDRVRVTVDVHKVRYLDTRWTRMAASAVATLPHDGTPVPIKYTDEPRTRFEHGENNSCPRQWLNIGLPAIMRSLSRTGDPNAS
jgi:hypothetical protein